MTCRLGTFAAFCRRSLMVRHMKNSTNFNALIHTSIVRFDDPIDIKMPSLSPTMTEGTIVKWLKKEGDTISPGDVICEIQTDKAIVGFELEEEGVLLKILVAEDTQGVPLGEVIAVIGSVGSTYEGPTKTAHTESPAVEKTPTKASKSEPFDIPKLLGPSVRKLLQEYNITFSAVSSSGPQNNVVKADVLNYINVHKLQPQLPSTEDPNIQKHVKESLEKVSISSYIDLPLTSMRKTIAKRLTESKTTVPHSYISIDCGVDQVMKLRMSMKQDGIRVSVNDFVIKSVAAALSKVPQLNVNFVNGKTIIMQSIDISVAVATENGLITPIIKNANRLSIQEISESVRNLAAKAREGKLRLEEFQGGSFTISNLGMFGISEFSAVINQPQGAILAIGATKLVVDEIRPVKRMTAMLSYDCRSIDEQIGGQFLKVLKSFLENPSLLLL